MDLYPMVSGQTGTPNCTTILQNLIEANKRLDMSESDDETDVAVNYLLDTMQEGEKHMENHKNVRCSNCPETTHIRPL